MTEPQPIYREENESPTTAEAGRHQRADSTVQQMRRAMQVNVKERPTRQSMTLEMPDGRLVSVSSEVELRRRYMAHNIVKRMRELVRDHHRTETGRKIKIDAQWNAVYNDCSTDMRLICAAQKGKTTWQLVKTFAQLTLGLSVGWVLPKEPKIGELNKSKLNPTIRNTPLYSSLVQQGDGSDSTRFKAFGQYGQLHLVTSNSESELTSFSADCMHVDERDFCNRKFLPMYTSRMEGSPYRLTDEISTVTVEGRPPRPGFAGGDNIYVEFLMGDQHRYFSICPHCRTEQILDWYENVLHAERDTGGRITSWQLMDPAGESGTSEDIAVCCRECRKPFDRGQPGVWKELNPGATMRSRWVEPLAIVRGSSLVELLEEFKKALGNPSKMQQFHNMKLARPYAGGNFRFAEWMFTQSTSGHGMTRESPGPCTIGIDVNLPYLDIHVSQWVGGVPVKLYVAKELEGVERVLELIKSMNIQGGVIDTQPESRFAMKLQSEAAKLGCTIVRARYSTHDQQQMWVESEKGDYDGDAPRLVSLSRTICIDELYERMVAKQVVWFRGAVGALDGMLFEEFFTPNRLLRVNDAGQERFIWDGSPDHQLHAAVYDLLAGIILGFDQFIDRSKIKALVVDRSHSLPSNTQARSGASRKDQPLIIRR